MEFTEVAVNVGHKWRFRSTGIRCGIYIRSGESEHPVSRREQRAARACEVRVKAGSATNQPPKAPRPSSTKLCPLGASLQPLRSQNMQERTLQSHKIALLISATPSGASAMPVLTSCLPACAVHRGRWTSSRTTGRSG